MSLFFGGSKKSQFLVKILMNYMRRGHWGRAPAHKRAAWLKTEPSPLRVVRKNGTEKLTARRGRSVGHGRLRNFDWPFMSRTELARTPNFGNMRFRRFPTFHFSTGTKIYSAKFLDRKFRFSLVRRGF